MTTIKKYFDTAEEREKTDSRWCPKYTHDEAITLLDILGRLCAAKDRFEALAVGRYPTGSRHSYDMMARIYRIDGHLKQAIDELCEFMRDERFFDDGKEEGAI